MKNMILTSENMIDRLKNFLESKPENITTVCGIKIIKSKAFPFWAEDGTTILGIFYGSNGNPVFLVDSAESIQRLSKEIKEAETK